MISDQITLLNEVTLECLNETDEVKIVTSFCEAGQRVLGADFGFVWLNSFSSPDLKLVYTSSNLPFTPDAPRKGGRNYRAIQNSTPNYVLDTNKARDTKFVSTYVKSFVIIPLVYKKSAYGSMVFCFKKHESFPKEKKTLSVFIGSSVAQTITINRLISDERTARLLEEERMKMRAIADANHELRTPIAIIQGTVDLALRSDGAHARSYKRALKEVKYEVKHLSGVLSNLTLLTPQDEGATTSTNAKFDTVDLIPLLKDISTRCEVLARKKNISIVQKAFQKISIPGSKFYLEKIFINLIKNSILYGTPGGQTSISFKKTKSSVSVSIADNGIGIAKEDLPHIFERFYRVTSAHAQGEEGTGLGLSIVKQAVEMHGGTIVVKSIKNKGTTCTVSLPLNKKNNTPESVL